ncbi:sacsin [Lampris incognitus]|uniref:sacsin n=1 Tax=Lampris incognitus TaxID=2546036 RepID=UPI0024B52B8E|nr:sacsin [Lampris incognitus]
MSLTAQRKVRTSFGATAPPFIDYLKDILRRYPDGGQILKELIQNADDAGATKVIFIHDERSYGKESLWSAELGKYQGPALYAYNNAAFTVDDWKGIQAAGRSVKRNDPNKVGRFGIGFNSVYHITDVPCIFSAGHIGLLDPQEKLFGKGNGGFQWCLEDSEDQECLMTLHDQFQPLQDIVSLVCKQKWVNVVNEDQHFDGTLFRFPLRNELSEISDNLYDSTRVLQLFDSFIADAELTPLFLKSVTSVSLMHIKADDSVKVMLQVKCLCSTDILETRDGSVVTGSTHFKYVTVSSQNHEETKKWLMTTCCMEEGNIAKLDSLAEKLCFLPQVDLAFPCEGKTECTDGRLSCFLPLPNNESNKTGLPVYVNACFGLTDNRRHIKWQEEDQKFDDAAVWNELLMKEVLPYAYLRIIRDAIKLAKDSELSVSSVYGLWPDLTKTQHRDRWHAVAQNVLQHMFGEDIAVLSLASNERNFVTPSEAVLPCNGPTTPEIVATIQRVLVSCGENLVTCPDWIARAIKDAYPHFSSLIYVTPSYLRAVFHKVGLPNMSEEDKLSVLEYVLSDGKYKELQGLQLLPLSDGTFRSFTKQEQDIAFIESNEFPRILLPGCKNLFIPENLNTTCYTHLRELASTNLFNVVNIDANQVTQYAKRCLPMDWEEMKIGHVTWNIDNSLHPPYEWLQEFWKFLNSHFGKLSQFIGMPLIPTSPLEDHPILLARLQNISTLISQKSKQTFLPDHIAQLVEKVGGTVVRGNEWLKHEDLDSYVLHPSSKSVMQVFANLNFQHVLSAVKTFSYEERQNLKVYLSGLDYLEVDEKDVLSRLPLFQTMNGSYVAAHSKQAVLLNSGLRVPRELPMPDSVVQCSTEVDCRLLKLLNIVILNTAQAANLLIDHVERKNFEQNDIERIMNWVLEHGDILFSQSVTLKKRCKEMNFIDVNGELKRASSFLDPRIENFKVLFESDLFPPCVYTQTPQMIDSLIDLGLLHKEMDITSSHMLHAATKIEELHPHSHQEAHRRFRVLLKLMDANDSLAKCSPQQLQSLSALKWVPCVKPGYKNVQKKKKSQQQFFCPNEMSHPMYMDIVGHVMPMNEELGQRVGSALGLRRLPPPEKVLENLSVLKSLALTMEDPDTDVNFKRELHSMYQYMQDHISSFKKVISKSIPWIWTNNRFALPKDVVINYPPNLDLSAHIGKVPQEFLPYKKLLREFGLRLSLTDEEIIKILYDMKENIEGRQQPFATSSELEVSIAILNWMWKEKKTIKDNIPVPIITESKQSTLKPLLTTVFCDISKEGLKDLRKNKEEFHVIHEEIPKATAEWLNIPLLSTRILRPELVGIEQCGQFEPITTRIKNILKEYDEQKDIFKELIQNAEDAGAKTCKFMVDYRIHRDLPESLFDPGMALCQGPCLWAFNDELFTKDDWENITRIGAASKENMVEKIGKFGLGFNTVYHLTDVPSILSGSTLLILDPNVTHLKKHIKGKTNPGIKLDLSKEQLLNWFPGQFRPYQHIFNCNFTGERTSKPYPGTLIKLPFRTKEEAFMSEISKKVYERDNIITFQQHLTNNSQTHLLFLKNINTVSLQNIHNNASTPPSNDQIKTVLTVSKTTVSMTKIPHMNEEKQSQAMKKLMNLNEKCKDIIDCTRVSIIKITQQHPSESNSQFWLLYNCFGTQQALQIALEENKQAKFCLPVGGIAVPLHIKPETSKWVISQKDFVGQAFCFLPLSIHTGLPVNVNGAFAVTSNRKGLWDSGVKSDWNKALLQDPAKVAYITVLLALKNMSKNNELECYSYHTFWPTTENVSEKFRPLVDAFYAAIANHIDALELFSDGKHWCSMNNAIFLQQSIEEDRKIGMLAMQVCQHHVKAPNYVIPLPLWLRNGFKQAGLEKILQSRIWNWETFYKEAVFCNLSTLDPNSRDTLVLHAIDLNISAVDKLLMSYPCIPTKGGELQYIKKLVNPSGKVACLFEQEEVRLLGGTKNDFLSPKRIQRLLGLGMLNDYLPLEDIPERTKRITSIWCKDKMTAYRLLKCILDLMRNPKVHDKSSHVWESLRMTAFIPAIPPLKKRNEMVTLCRPTDVFSDKHSLLVNMTYHVVDHSNLKIHSDDPVLQILGAREIPDPDTVLNQLQEACSQSQFCNKTMLHRIADECYRFLNQWLNNGGDARLISMRAHSFPFILINGKFVHVDSVAENEEFEAKPYLNVLPTDFTAFKKLWECVGVKKCFTVSQFLTVLKKLHALHGNNPLPDSDLKICLTILHRGYDVKEKMLSDCFIPNQHSILEPASKLYYNDSPWMPVGPGITLCHEKIPRVVACHLGIQTTRHQTLQNHLVENISPFHFEFEQREQLTTRIKNIIAAYPSKKDILKELIQNADDAEATEIHFVWDRRKHGTEKTFGKKWNQLQGPALCVYNNKVFSDVDLKGIQQLGEGGKHSIPWKTGKYGIGFNSVYHLTDCPSILTGDKLLCISDPNQKYIENASKKSQAGCGYKLSKVFKETYSDVYKSFLPDAFALEEGTMFRLPLRMGTMANNSKISNQGVTELDMQELSSALCEDPEGLILFLKNIRKMKFHDIDPVTGQLKDLFVVEKRLTDKSNNTQVSFQKYLQSTLQSDSQVTPHKAIYDIQISTSDRRQSEWIIAEQFGSFKSNTGREIEESNRVPQASLAAFMNCKPHRKEEFNGVAFCSLPLPGKTGLPVHVNGNFEVDSSRKNLWKADGQSLETNWNDSLKKNIIAPLYADLLHYIRLNIPNVKVTSVHVDNFHLDGFYLRFFPVVSKDVDQHWHNMIHAVYRSIEEKAIDVIPVLHSSTRNIAQRSIKEFSFNWCNIRETEPTTAPHLPDPKMSGDIICILEELGMRLVPISSKMEKIWANFRLAGVEVKHGSSSNVRDFLKEKPLNDSNQIDSGLPLPITCTLIKDEMRCSKLLKFCLEDVTEDNSSSVNGLPLLLTKDKVLRVFHSSLPKMISRYDNLFFGFEDKFADYLTNLEHMDVLQDLSFLSNLTIVSAGPLLETLPQHPLDVCEVDPICNLRVPSETTLKWLKELWKFIVSEVKPALFLESSDKQGISTVMEIFCNKGILPVMCPRLNNKPYLQTMKDMESVILYSSEEDISSILFKLGCMKLNLSFFTEVGTHIPLLLQPGLMNISRKTCVLNQVCKLNHAEFRHLSDEEFTELQQFLQSGVSTSEDKQEYERKLKSLPLFETIHSERVSIDGPGQVFILDMSTNPIKTFSDLFSLCDNHSIFLKSSAANHNLSDSLEIPILTDIDYFLKFLLPVLDKLTETQILQSIKMFLNAKQSPNYQKHQKTIISAMKPVKFIRSIHGDLEKASYYYDVTVELYKLMLPQEKFVPTQFWDKLCGGENMMDQVKTLLQELGMKHKVSKEEVIQFAYQIESEAKQKYGLEELKVKSSKLLIRAIKIASDKERQAQNLLKNMADIKFIFPVKIKEELCNFHSPFASGMTTVAIRGSLIQSDPNNQNLIWTSMPIIALSVLSTQKHHQMVKDAGAYEQPPQQCVTRNMSNICQLPCQSDDLIKTRAAVFSNCYAYLQGAEFDSQHLTGLPIVLVENDSKLVKVEETSLGLLHDSEFRPYLYKIPAKYIKFAEFFKAIGVQEEPTALQYCNVLSAIYADTCDKQTLNPNQLITVKRAVEQLFNLNKAQENDSVIKLPKILHFPSTDGRLYSSTTLYYNDTVFLASRLEGALEGKWLMLEKLSACYLGNDIYEHRRLLQLLPEGVRPRMLSHHTRENVLESNIQFCEHQATCEFSGWFENHLSSRAFRYGLICLMREQSQGKLTLGDADDMCQQTFGCIQIVCCKILETELSFDQQPLSNTSSETEVYVKKEQEGCIFYLKHSDDITAPKVINSVCITLTKEINALLGYKVASDHLTILGQLLMCDSLLEVQNTLARHGILDSAKTDHILFNPPNPGTAVTEEWHDFLDMDILNNFEEGEYVGYMVNDEYIHAVIIAQLPGPSGLYSRKYKIQISPEEVIEVSSLDLYQFVREKKPKQTEKTHTSAEASCWELEPRTGVESHDSSSTSTTSPSSARPSSTLPASLEEAKKEIDRCLAEIWTLSEEEKQKAIKRLYLKWHPDKNPDYEQLATEAFKYLKNRINELTNGKGAKSSCPESNTNFRNFYEKWNQEANRHKQGRERFFRGHRSHSYNSWRNFSNFPKPNREEAHRWYRQARCDLTAAYKDAGGGSTEWCLFKIHQAVEKSLIAAEYKRNGKRPTSCSISFIAARVSTYNPQLSGLPQIVENLILLGVDAKKTQYPNFHPSPHIPNEQFKSESEVQALHLASEILNKIETYVN